MKTSLTASIAAALLAALAATSAGAQLTAAAGAGQARWRGCFAVLPCDRTDTSYAVRLGYHWTPYFGVELRYADLGETRTPMGQGTDESGAVFVPELFVGARGVGLNAVVTAPLSSRASVCAIAGIASLEARAGIRSTGPLQFFDALYHGTDRNAAPYYGLRAGWRFTPEWGAGVEAVRYRVDFRGIERDVDVVVGEISYRFP